MGHAWKLWLFKKNRNFLFSTKTMPTSTKPMFANKSDVGLEQDCGATWTSSPNSVLDPLI